MNGTFVYSLSEALFLGIANTFLCGVFLPLHFALIWILAARTYESVIIYRILKHFCVANVMSLFSTFMSGIFELLRSSLCDVIDITSGSLSSWFKVACCLLNLLLAINQCSVVFEFVIPSYMRINFRYEFETHWFNEPSELVEGPVLYVRHFTTVIYAIIVCKAVYTKFKQKKILQHFVLIEFLQILGLHMPAEFLNIFRAIFKSAIDSLTQTKILYIFVYRAVAVVPIVVVLSLNKDLQRKMIELPKKIKTGLAKKINGRQIYCSR
ncbi:hypothetical protein L596_022800 [Steinernema carpocapsae]|uniref:Uncharacterized protein n=1 Tax=Steinernema carpocapsae TaxID=34508 RepID=A0A4U5MMS1_STECR|nr:hypothetical protein L596_022800 [Steinernema carpocapsae]